VERECRDDLLRLDRDQYSVSLAVVRDGESTAVCLCLKLESNHRILDLDSSSYHYIYFNRMVHLRVSTDHVIEQVRQLTLSGPLHSHTTSGRGENGAVAEEYAPMALS
jgi:hypothetical protein